ncbi:RDD family protein [Methanobrevibacter filiformis]|uniref:RDD family protein n=1 Tax=Methanobrevibacter filiformis TaxID=55758 RepID=A0A166DAH5_9EURY|nr:RDD family protein [Methanobrevibacter filiformis]KZX15380.1 RDD family protein [Methanobrevibacter filiformis]
MVSIFKKRIIAYIADFFVISAFLWIFAQILAFIVIPHSMFLIYNYFIYLLPIIIIVYFVLLEKIKGTTVGKHLMFLKVKSNTGGSISFFQAILRNISKLYWLPIILDILIGYLTGGSKDRILNKLSKTNVVEE